MHPWRGRSRPPQQELNMQDPDAVLGERHPQVIACETFFGAPVRRFEGVTPQVEPLEGWARAWDLHQPFGLKFDDEQIRQAHHYLDSGLVWHVDVLRRQVRGIVLGSQLYAVEIDVAPIPDVTEAELIEALEGRVNSVRDVTWARMDDELVGALGRPGALVPEKGEVRARCSCANRNPCKHAAAVLLALGHRFSVKPGEIFRLRGTSAEVLRGILPPGMSKPPPSSERIIDLETVANVFDLRLEIPPEPELVEAPRPDPLADFLEHAPKEEPARVEALEPPTPPPQPPPAPARAAGGWLDDDWDDDDSSDDEVFGGSLPTQVSVGSIDGEEILEIGRADLLELGLPSHRIQRWLSDGTLVRTPKRGQYQLTPDAWAMIEPLLPSD
ncbi:MAG: SWIM zinc finger family protein [Myxococcota bacterium]